MTKIDIVSGFLGAGKTTLIKKMVKEAYPVSYTHLHTYFLHQIPFSALFKRPADIAVLIQAGRSIPGHVAAGVAGFGQGPDLGGDLIGAIGVIGLPDGVVALDPGAHRGKMCIRDRMCSVYSRL